jgi:uroporphyrinogen-III synthase
MRILLTRARADAERTAARLTLLGHQSIISPVIEIVGFAAKTSVQKRDAVIATSAHAFTAIDVRELAQTSLYVVGERTREAASAAGWIAPIHVGADARELTALLRQDSQRNSPRLRHLLYLAGRDRKPDIEAAARDMGLGCEVVETYAAREVSSLTREAEDALRAGMLGAALHYSRRSAELFVALAQRAGLWKEAKKLAHFALSADAAEPLAAAGAPTAIAACPDEDHLLELLYGPRLG